ncbi:hypothetical protein [Streptomyces sp. MI02-7b]|uniref:hypothetical protein n=1 Tax=Streptomyces sp. MI02-7b TaxID=462941 RepID=UPI0029B5E679|nr:hypothetical protein [Streptomyces sp. MI02-7b]MDX3076436.1 hypothetical protein [Streptomyces sp. MI02-7b]
MTPVMASPVRAGADLRLLRAAVFTAVCVALSAVAHSVASGHAVPGWSLVAGWVMVFAVVAPLAGRERSLPGIAAGLAAGQLALHVLFNAGGVCGPDGAPRPDGIVRIAGRLICAHQALPLAPATAQQIVRQAGIDPHTLPLGGMGHMSGMAGMTGMTHAHTESTMLAYSLPMLLGHLLAALAAGWLLRRGEAALWRMVALGMRGLAELTGAALRQAVALVRALVAGALTAPSVTGGPRRRTAGSGPPRTAALRHSLARRGPPVHALAA